MEAAYDDWCAAQMAKSLGRKDDAELFKKRAERWRNVVDFSCGFARGKNKNGEWREKFSPVKLAGDFCEGNSWQYTFHVMQNVPALIEMAGGREKFVEKLDMLFSLEASAEEMGEVLDVTGLIGQYAHGNEPSHHIIYLYTMAGRRDKTAKLAKRICETFYTATPDGICGNEDGGQMSAWYIFSTMGFYPVNPCGGEYILGAPQVAKTTLRLPNRKTFTVIAKNPGGEVKAGDKVFLNGKELKKMKISHADILAGGELVFE
jgi:predicted alpha-1,2-mannosidase